MAATAFNTFHGLSMTGEHERLSCPTEHMERAHKHPTVAAFTATGPVDVTALPHRFNRSVAPVAHTPHHVDIIDLKPENSSTTDEVALGEKVKFKIPKGANYVIKRMSLRVDARREIIAEPTAVPAGDEMFASDGTALPHVGHIGALPSVLIGSIEGEDGEAGTKTGLQTSGAAEYWKAYRDTPPDRWDHMDRKMDLVSGFVADEAGATVAGAAALTNPQAFATAAAIAAATEPIVNRRVYQVPISGPWDMSSSQSLDPADYDNDQYVVVSVGKDEEVLHTTSRAAAGGLRVYMQLRLYVIRHTALHKAAHDQQSRDNWSRFMIRRRVVAGEEQSGGAAVTTMTRSLQGLAERNLAEFTAWVSLKQRTEAAGFTGLSYTMPRPLASLAWTRVQIKDSDLHNGPEIVNETYEVFEDKTDIKRPSHSKLRAFVYMFKETDTPFSFTLPHVFPTGLIVSRNGEITFSRDGPAAEGIDSYPATLIGAGTLAAPPAPQYRVNFCTEEVIIEKKRGKDVPIAVVESSAAVRTA